MTYKRRRAASLRAIRREIAEKGREQFHADTLATYARIRQEAIAMSAKPYTVYRQPNGTEYQPGWYYEFRGKRQHGPYDSDWDAIAAAERSLQFDEEDER